jgi:hypothetical protein
LIQVAYIIIIKGVLKSQHLVVTDIWRIVELVGIRVILALIKIVCVILA